MEHDSIDQSLLEVREWREHLNQQCEQLGGIQAEDFSAYLQEKATIFRNQHRLRLKEYVPLVLQKSA